MRFSQHIGIDYSGAAVSSSRLKGLQVYAAERGGAPRSVQPPGGKPGNWNRQEVAEYCARVLAGRKPVIVGIDHGFSLPMSYMQRHRLSDWDAFLADFAQHWPTYQADTSVESLRTGNPRGGASSELRLCEQWTATAKSVFQFDMQGSVAKSTHAGLPWLWWLRGLPGLQGKVHCWPFDGFDVKPGKSVLTEAYPALYKRRYAKEGRSPDQQDAWAIAAWMQEADERGILERYFQPPINQAERRRAALEGWILGVC